MSDLTDEPTRGDNGGGAADPDLYLEYVREQTLDMVEKDKIVGRMRNRTKRAKAAGIDTDADALVSKLAKLDPDNRHALMQNASKQAAWRGLTGFNPGVDPNAEQADIWPEPSADIKQGHQDAVIYSDGSNSRRAGADRGDNVQMAGSRDYQTWDRGWLDADQDIMGQPGAAQAASTERRPRTGKADGTIKDGGEPEKPKRGKKAAATTLADDVDAAEASSGIGSEASAIH